MYTSKNEHKKNDEFRTLATCLDTKVLQPPSLFSRVPAKERAKLCRRRKGH